MNIRDSEKKEYNHYCTRTCIIYKYTFFYIARVLTAAEYLYFTQSKHFRQFYQIELFSKSWLNTGDLHSSLVYGLVFGTYDIFGN